MEQVVVTVTPDGHAMDGHGEHIAVQTLVDHYGRQGLIAKPFLRVDFWPL